MNGKSKADVLLEQAQQAKAEERIDAAIFFGMASMVRGTVIGMQGHFPVEEVMFGVCRVIARIMGQMYGVRQGADDAQAQAAIVKFRNMCRVKFASSLHEEPIFNVDAKGVGSARPDEGAVATAEGDQPAQEAAAVADGSDPNAVPEALPRTEPAQDAAQQELPPTPPQPAAHGDGAPYSEAKPA